MPNITYVIANEIKAKMDKLPENEYMIKIQGSNFQCLCGCMVFGRIDPNNRLTYFCKNCEKIYEVD